MKWNSWYTIHEIHFSFSQLHADPSLNDTAELRHMSQLKGRVYEAMQCGCVVLESGNPHTSALFQDGSHFMAFSGVLAI